MSDINKQLRHILQQTENSLREVIAKAAKSGDYDGIDEARRAAGGVRDILVDLVAEPLVNEDRAASRKSNGASRHQAAPVARKSAKREYPKFLVKNGVLFKFGYSKKRDGEYVHKIPRDVYDEALRAIGDVVGNGGKLFTSEDVAKKLESRRIAVPIYQVYLTLTFLREHGVAQKQGRDGYFAKPDVVALGAKLWDELCFGAEK